MKSLIIHIGPPKCGSSSIQQFFQNNKSPCIQNIRFIKLNMQTINLLSEGNESDSINFIHRIHKNIDLYDCLILSSEALFHNPKAIKYICKFASSKASKIIIIGYSRRASKFMVSAYNQWWFRSPGKIKGNENLILEYEIRPLHFLGAERHLIASILSDFTFPTSPIMDWINSYDIIEKIVSPFNAVISVGTLPTRTSSVNLIQDFCNRANLTLKNKCETIELKSNPSFNSHLTESVNNAVEMGINMPNPHSENVFFHEFSKIFNTELYTDNEFFFTLKEYIDSYFYESNLALCNKYNLDERYFAVSKKYEKNEILEIIRSEDHLRDADNTLLKKYRKLSGIMAEACFHSYKTKNKDGHYE